LAFQTFMIFIAKAGKIITAFGGLLNYVHVDIHRYINFEFSYKMWTVFQDQRYRQAPAHQKVQPTNHCKLFFRYAYETTGGFTDLKKNLC